MAKPKITPEQIEAHEREQQAEILDFIEKEGIDQQAKPLATPVAKSGSSSVRPSSSGPKVLIVDSDASIRELSALQIGKGGYQALEAGSAKEAIVVIADNPNIELIFIDFQLKGLDGITFLQQLRKQQILDGVPIIMTTGVANDKLLKQALRLGISGCIVKPFDPPTVLKHCKKAIKKKVS